MWILFRIHDKIRCKYYATSNNHENDGAQWNESADGLDKEASSSSPIHELAIIVEQTPNETLRNSQAKLSIKQDVTDLNVASPLDETVILGIDCQLPLQRSKEGLLYNIV